MLAEPQALEDMTRARASFGGPRGRYDLPGLIERADVAFRVKRSGLRLVSQGGRYGLVREGTRQAVEVPAAMQPQVAWVLERDRIRASASWRQHSRARGPAKLDRLLGDLQSDGAGGACVSRRNDCGKSATTSAGMPGPRTTMIAMGG